MALLSLDWIARVGQSAMRGIPFFGSALGLVAFIYDLGERMLAAGLNYALSVVSSLDTSAFSEATFGGVVGIGYANAVFPLSEFVTIWTAVFTAAGSILAIRWVKSFIPTVAN